MKFQNENAQDHQTSSLTNGDKGHLLSRTIGRIYHLKLWLVLLVLVLLMICFYMIDALKDKIPQPWTWLSFFPWQSLAGTALGVILIAFAYEWFVRKETEEKLVQMLQQHLRFQEDAISKHITQAMLIDKSIMQRVLAHEMIDIAIRTGLEVRLGDEQLASETYDNLLSQLLLSNERRSNYRCRISLTTIKDNDASDAIKNKYYEGYIDERYDVILQKSSYSFTCVGTSAEYNELLRDRGWELRWLAEPTKDFPDVDISVFNIEKVTVNGIPLVIKREQNKKKIVITADHPQLSGMIGRHVTVHYSYKVKIQKRGHLLRVNTPCPTKNVVIEFDYRDTDIHFVNVQNFFVSKTEPEIRYPSQPALRMIEIEVNEWVFPNGGVVFGWVLSSEMTPDFLKLLERSH